MPEILQKTPSDAEILALYRQEGKREEAFNLIVKSYKVRTYWHIRRMTESHEDTDDILQTTFVKIWTYLPDFRGDSQLYTWIYRIATNEAITFLNKKKISESFSLDMVNNVQEKFKADEYFNGDAIQTALRNEILKLPPKQRAVFTLRYFQELKYEEIAKILDTSEGALKASYHHAYIKIKTNLENCF
jgi:RNA polymerase sigma factor (sigma-70 family)